MNKNKDCRPKFDPQPLQQVTHQWTDKLFITASLPQFLHMPLASMYSKVVTRLWNKAQQMAIAPEIKDFLLLAFDPSPWKSVLYLAVTKDAPGANAVKLSGTYVSMVFDGPYSGVPKYIKEMKRYVETIERKSKKYYFYFTTCPKCAKKYGHNYIVALCEV